MKCVYTAEPPKVAIIREEGSNGDREMAAAFSLAGFEAWDVNMDDLIAQRISLSAFRGVAFVGGFSYADVCGSAKGEIYFIHYFNVSPFVFVKLLYINASHFDLDVIV